MSTSKILITGITGQDGIFLSSNLIENYEDVQIIGTTRSKLSSQFSNKYCVISFSMLLWKLGSHINNILSFK